MHSLSIEHQEPVQLDGSNLSSIWTHLDSKRASLLRRCEDYAAWTIPSVCPEDNITSGEELRRGSVAIGATVVNHLANRIITTMFPSDKPFFRLAIKPEAKRRLRQELGEEELGNFEENIRSAMIAAENEAMSKLGLTAYIPNAIRAIKHQIITGNAVIRRHKDGRRSVYGIKNFVIVRDISGDVIFCMLRDQKRISNLPPDLQELLSSKQRNGEATCTLYTRFRKVGQRWHQDQALDEYPVPNSAKTYKETDLPVLVLAWDLSHGEDYGRGLVEDHSVLFNNIDVVSEAIIDLVGIAADVKWLVRPSAQTDVQAWNEAARGQYLIGEDGDITAPEFKKRVELQIMSEMIAQWERRLSQGFLHNTSGVRDAERVTAEEIRMFARELESAFGGLYSNLALQWQKKEAQYLLSQIPLNNTVDGQFEFTDVTVTTGLESLTREGQLDNLRLALSDLAILEGIPEEYRGAIHPMRFAKRIFELRGVSLEDIFRTGDEIKEENARLQQQQQQMMQMQGQQDVAVEAGKAAVRKQG